MLELLSALNVVFFLFTISRIVCRKIGKVEAEKLGVSFVNYKPENRQNCIASCTGNGRLYASDERLLTAKLIDWSEIWLIRDC